MLNKSLREKKKNERTDLGAMVFWFGIEMGIRLGKVMVNPTEVWIKLNYGLNWTEAGGLIILEKNGKME